MTGLPLRHFLYPAFITAFAAAGAAALADAKAVDPAKLPPPAAAQMDFVRDIRPIFAAKCYACHGPDRQMGGLRLHRAADGLAGGDSGPVIVPGKSAESRLVHLVAGLVENRVMPPAGPRLTSQQVGVLRAWIDQGASWPDTADTAAPQSTHWAFRPIKPPSLPKVRNQAWVINPIDVFILARLEQKGLRPSPPADRVTLIRRASLDLTGLPPTPEEVDAFISDRQPGAYERVVDRLLASPHYGEKWGRHWLDQARYADSNGYTIDGPRQMWMYRDWVINALNQDMPFDQFTIQQLAGDLLWEEVRKQGNRAAVQGNGEMGKWGNGGNGKAAISSFPHFPISSGTPSPVSYPDVVVATGFHRNTLINEEGGTDQEQFRVEAVADRVSTTGSVWLGLTVGCAQCHSHKFDPISQREYYRLFAFFNNADEPTVTFPTPEQTRQQEELKAQLAAARKELADYDQAQKAKGVTQPAKSDAVRVRLAARVTELQARDKDLARAIPSAMVMKERETPRVTNVHLRGDFLRKGAVVEPGVPGVLPPLPAEVKRPTRLDLARWLVDPRNPLTPRVIVNRIWQQHFGHGLVETENDFGTQGTPPTHPELLDWLASYFVAGVRGQAGYPLRGWRVGGKPVSSPSPIPHPPSPSGAWSLKNLHRLIVTSATYRQSSAIPNPQLLDPQNKLLGRQNRLRLEAEVIRDAALAASGLLSRKMGGPSVFPPQPAGTDAFTQVKKNWKVSEGEDRYRRGVYTWRWRSSPYALFAAFDAPDGNVTCTRRVSSNTPLQSLMLANDEGFFEMAQGLASRVMREATTSDEERLRSAFRRCLSREPSPAEAARVLEYYRSQVSQFEGAPQAAEAAAPKNRPEGMDAAHAAAWTAVARVLMNLDEFITRE
jgi:mono/diheme cytochrome c family protein/ribosomal protein L29